jgi:putative NIF3 family GTP cyclohydrolase 1 type 2
MRMGHSISRRRFVQLATATGALTLAGRLSYADTLTARQIVDVIKAKIGVPWDEKSYRDTFKMGDPDTPVKGIATTFMSTLDVLQRANQAGLNFVISHEPTLWSDADTLSEAVLDDPLYQFKKEFVDKNQMIVWRIHDHWHATRPEPMATAWNKLLGWDKYVVPGTHTYKFPPTPLKTLSAHVAAKLESKSVRIVGDPNLMVTTLGHGGHALANNVLGLAPDDVDAVVTFEAREVDSEEYVRDLALSGKKKGMILIAHEAGEEAGMVLFTDWLPAAIPGIRVVNVPTRDRMWIA